MRFCEYKSQRYVALTTPGISEARSNLLRSMSNADYVEDQLATATKLRVELQRQGRIRDDDTPLPGDKEAYLALATINECIAEREWFGANRPFYNVYPVVADMIAGVKLSLRLEQVTLPYSAMLFQFAEAERPLLGVGSIKMRLNTALWYAGPNHIDKRSSGRLWVCIPNFEEGVVPNWTLHTDEEGQTVEDVLAFCANDLQNQVSMRSVAEQRDVDKQITQAIEAGTSAVDAPIGPVTVYNEAFEWCFRLLTLASLLAAGSDLITPVLLRKDQDAMESLGAQATEQWIESRAEKARRRGVLGFDIGRSLQADRDRSPHYRNPHLALFHVGPGRSQPRVQLRRGSVVVSHALTKIPTGFHGPESEEDIRDCNAVTTREPLSPRTRFFILKRDDYRCQICGASARDDKEVKLHIDHKVAVANGGRNSLDNLWVLCSTCNLGKGDNHL